MDGPMDMYYPTDNDRTSTDDFMPSIVELAVNSHMHSILVSVLTLPVYADLLNEISGDGPFTIFAPTDSAFEKANIDLDPSDVAAVSELLKYHVVYAEVLLSDLEPYKTVLTIQGEDLVVTKNSDGVFVNGNARVVEAEPEW
jgi:transforming growth factor-beta-induced protein